MFRKRTYAGFKRKAAGHIARPFKRGRFRRRFRGRRSTQFNDKSGYGSILRFRGRKLRRRTWNNMLWRTTLQQQHYRTNGSLGGSIVTPLGNTTVTIITTGAMDNGVASFWQSGGGVVSPDPLVAIPIFRGDLVWRGGIVGLQMHNEAAQDVQITVYLIRNAPRPTYANVPATAPVGWDPTLVSEFRKDVGTVVFSKKFLLDQAASATVERRIPIMKIDQESWSVDASRYTWLIAASDTDTAIAATVRLVLYFNGSFSGDAIGTT